MKLLCLENDGVFGVLAVNHRTPVLATLLSLISICSGRILDTPSISPQTLRSRMDVFPQGAYFFLDGTARENLALSVPAVQQRTDPQMLDVLCKVPWSHIFWSEEGAVFWALLSRDCL